MNRGALERSRDTARAGSLVSARDLHACAIWGVINVTPDSFSDGGLHATVAEAIAHGARLLAEGADVIDVGGESTRPAGAAYGSGFGAVGADEERARVVPVISALVRGHGATVSVDTTKASVAEAAIAAGASYVNDVSMGASDALLSVVASSDARLVLMHTRGRGEITAANTAYEDVVEEVRRDLLGAADRAAAAGVAPTRIWLDPGIGFAKTAGQSLTLLGRLERLVDTGYPVLVGASRKSLIAHAAPRPDGSAPPPLERLGGTAATVVASALAGAAAVRVHDVAPMRQAMLVALAIAERSARR